METGILPDEGSLKEQSAEFVDLFPFFVMRWKDRTYNKIWSDVQEHTKRVLEAVFPKS